MFIDYDKNSVLVECSTCFDKFKYISYTELTLVCNRDTEAWTQTFQCPECGGRNVNPINPFGVLHAQYAQAETLVMSSPIPSPRPDGPVFTEDDVEEFHEFLRVNSFLTPLCGNDNDW